MSSTRFAAPLELDLVPSRMLCVGGGMCHLLALASLAVCSLPFSASVIAATLVVVSLASGYARHGARGSPWFITQVHWSVDGAWTLHTASGSMRPARLLGSYVHPRLVILNFALGRFVRRSVVVLPDSADPQEVRRLRMRLLSLRRPPEVR